jgi:GT2 family glycosyltransferase
LLAFGASADFLAGRVTRAPGWVSDSGMEWGWRLAQEPRRLSRRYLVDGPPAYWRIRQSVPVAGVPDLDGWQVVGPATGPASRNAPRGTKAGAEGTPRGAHGSTPSQRTADRPTFVPSGEDADVVAIVVTHNNVAEIGALLHDLREEARDLRLRVVVVDNDSTDGTLDLVSTVPGVVTVASGANRGYAGGVNVGTAFAGSSRALLVLNADIRVRRHTVRALWRRLWQPGVGAVVPRLLAVDGETFPSLRFEPSLLRTVGDALLGERLPGRPTWASEVDLAEESYRFAHPIHWATGAALLVRAAVAEQVGAWDEEFFLYSEETDYQRRIRDAGWEVWFDPAGRVVHAGQASGHSPELAALLAVNRVRYVGRYHRRAYERAVQAAAATGAALRWGRGEEARCALRYLLDRRTWDRLPAAPLNGAPADLRSVDAPRQPERRARHGARP